MLITSSKNKNEFIKKDIVAKVKKLTTEDKILIYDLVDLISKASNYHKDYDSEQIITWFVNPLLKKQLLTHYDNKLKAVLTLGFLNTNAEQKLLKKIDSFTIEDWSSGSNIWLVDCIAPYGHAATICSQARFKLSKMGFSGKKIHYKRDYKNGKTRLASSVI
jgi:hemolysin-activating ACP:hemolysin acyltransferase